MRRFIGRHVVPAPKPYENEDDGVKYAEALAKAGQTLSWWFSLVGWVFILFAAFLAVFGASHHPKFTLQIPKKDEKEAGKGNGTKPESKAEAETTKAETKEAGKGNGTKSDEGNTITVTAEWTYYNWLLANFSVICGVCAVALGAIGWQTLDRSSSAALLAVAATEAFAKATASQQRLVKTTSKRKYKPDFEAYMMCLEAKKAWLEGRMNHDRIMILSQKFQDSQDSK